MIFDLNDNPTSDNEYQQRLLAMTILLVKACGGQVIVPKRLMADLQAEGGKTFLTQDVDPLTGNMTLTVGRR